MTDQQIKEYVRAEAKAFAKTVIDLTVDSLAGLQARVARLEKENEKLKEGTPPRYREWPDD